MYGNFKSMQDTWGRALAVVAAMGSKLGGGWMGGCAQKARMGWGPSQCIEAASKDENSSVRLAQCAYPVFCFVTTWMHSRWAVGSRAFRQCLTARWLLDSQVSASAFVWVHPPWKLHRKTMLLPAINYASFAEVMPWELYHGQITSLCHSLDFYTMVVSRAFKSLGYCSNICHNICP